MNWIKKYKTILVIAAVPVLVALWWLFRPEKLWVTEKVNEPAPFATPADQPALIATGKLEARKQPTKGRATIYKGVDGKFELRLTDFETAQGDNLRVLLASPEDGALQATDAKQAPIGADLGSVQAGTMEQRFAVPSSVDVTKLSEVVLYDSKLNQVFGVAKLEAF